MAKKLTRSIHDKMISGVCGGLADYFGINSTLVRILFVILTFLVFGTPILLYFVLALIMPEE